MHTVLILGAIDHLLAYITQHTICKHSTHADTHTHTHTHTHSDTAYSIAISNHPYIESRINIGIVRQIASPYISCITRLNVRMPHQHSTHLPTTLQCTQQTRASQFCHIPIAPRWTPV